MVDARLPLSCVVLLVALAFVGVAAEAKAEAGTKQAYVTLLYGDAFLLGVRVLGQSIRDTGTTKDLVVLVSEGVSNNAIEVLKADGWIVQRIDLLANPNRNRPTRFWGVYTKLKIFNLIQYDKIVYLDADTIVVKSIEELFLCQKFCANLKHSEKLNSGVMVVEPSKELFDDMMSNVSTMYSYTGGDQGFLNSYFPDFPNAELFDPTLSPSQRKPKSMERLSTLYNADVGLYMLANKWMVDASELRVVHYTLGPLKPWDWWTEWLLKPVDLWQNVRARVKDTSSMDLQVFFLILIPIASTSLLLWLHSKDVQSVCGVFRQLIHSGTMPGAPVYSNGRAPVYVGIVSILVFFLVALVSVGISFWLIPRQVMPWTGLILLYEWTFFLVSFLYGKYLNMVFEWGKRKAGNMSLSPDSSDSRSKGHSKSLRSVYPETTVYGFALAFLAILVVGLPFLFNVTALFSRLGMIVGMGLIFVAFATYAAEHSGSRWFVLGRDEA